MQVVYICIGFMVLFLIFTVILVIYSIKRENTIKEKGIKTQAKVLGYFNQDIRQFSISKILNRRCIPIKRMILEFIDEEGQKHIILNKLQDSSISMKYKAGSIINVLYQKKTQNNLIERVNQKYEEFYDRSAVRDEEGIEYKLTDDSNKFDIVYLDKKHYNGEKELLITVSAFILLAGIIGVVLGISALK